METAAGVEDLDADEPTAFPAEDDEGLDELAPGCRTLFNLYKVYSGAAPGRKYTVRYRRLSR